MAHSISTVDAIFDPEVTQAALKFCASSLNTGLLPSTIKSPQQALLILLKGQEIGLQPMEALCGIDIIQGKATLQATTMSALLLRGGVAIETIKLDKGGCKLRMTRTVGGRVVTIEPEFTMEDAEDAGIASKDNWLKWKKDMLYARCLSRGGRRIGADILAGAYVEGEVERPAPIATGTPGFRDIEAAPADKSASKSDGLAARLSKHKPTQEQIDETESARIKAKEALEASEDDDMPEFENVKP